MAIGEKIWGEDNEHPNEALQEKLNSEGKLVGAEALALLAGDFSNATHGNYSARRLFDRVFDSNYKITVEKVDDADQYSGL